MNGAIILARIDSSRFPNKAITKVGNKLLIQHCIDEVKKLGKVKVILATSARKIDDPLEQVAKISDIDCFRGDSENVAKRVLDCIIKNKIDSFARINGDSPFTRVSLLEDGFQIINHNNYDLVTNLLPRRYPYGMSVEIIRGETFRKVYAKISESKYYTEHISSIFYDQQEEFKIGKIPYKKGLNHSDVRLTVDTLQDKELIDKMFYIDTEIGNKSISEIVSLYLKVKG